MKDQYDKGFPDKKYRTIYADPPWPIQLISRKVRPNQLDMPYQTMSLQEIKDLPVSKLADDKCMLFLWTTHKWLPKAFEVIEAWGFNYNCMLTWDKTYGFTPFGFMWSTEFCLFAQRQNHWIDLKQLGLKTLVRQPPTKHSSKPHSMRRLIEKVSYEPRIELFARTKVHGWDVWGNDEKLQLEPLEAFSNG